MWTGFFLARETGTHVFSIGTNVDDQALIWIGPPAALGGWTLANALVNYNYGGWTTPSPSGSISLVACTYYPIRVEFGAPRIQTVLPPSHRCLRAFVGQAGPVYPHLIDPFAATRARCGVLRSRA